MPQTYIGWDGCVLKHCSSGQWTSEESRLHINAKELKVILFTLQSFVYLLKGCHVQIMCWLYYHSHDIC